jgi:hypothetical protein
MYGFKKLRGFRKPETAQLYFSVHNNITRWLEVRVDLGRTANTVAKSGEPKVNSNLDPLRF